MKSCFSQSQHRTTVSADLHKCGSCIMLSLIQKWQDSWLVLHPNTLEQIYILYINYNINIHTSPCIFMTGTIATAMRQGLESVRLLVKVHMHRQIPVTHVCDGAVAGHGNTWRHDTCGVVCHCGMSPMSAPTKESHHAMQHSLVSCGTSRPHVYRFIYFLRKIFPYEQSNVKSLIRFSLKG